MKEMYAAYEMATGEIVQTGKVDRSVTPDGSTFAEYLARYLIKYPNRDIVYTGNMIPVDIDAKKVVGGVVVDQTTAEQLAAYQKKHKGEQKDIGKQLFVDYRDELDTSEANALTYKNSIKAYFVSDVKNPIDAAVDKAGVDIAVSTVDFNSVTKP